MKLLGQELTKQELNIVKNNPMGAYTGQLWHSLVGVFLHMGLLYTTMVHPTTLTHQINGWFIVIMGTLMVIGIVSYYFTKQHITNATKRNTNNNHILYDAIRPNASCFDWPFGPVRVLYTIMGVFIYTVLIVAYLYQGWTDLAVGMGTLMVLSWLTGIGRMGVARAVLDYHVDNNKDDTSTCCEALSDVT